MPRLPTANDLGRVSLRPATGVASPDLSAPYRAAQQLGNQVTQIAGEVADDQNRLAYGQAQTAWLQGQADTHAAFEKDNDYATMQDRYGQQMQKVTESSASGITSGRMRQEFDNWVNQQNIRGGEQIRSLAWSKEKDASIAGLNQSLETSRSTYLTSTDPETRQQITDATNNMIHGAASKGYIDQAQAQQLGQRWITDAATDSLKMMQPEQRLSALQNPTGIVSFLPPDQRQAMMKDASYEALNTRLGQQQLQMYTGDAGMNVLAVPQATLLQAVYQQESGNRHRNADGSLVTSPAGAQGAGQIMPPTGKDPGFGVKPLQDDSEQENRRFTGDYLNAMLKRYSGNQILALAAYNAGPGKVDDWLKQIGDPRTGQVSNEQFAASIPFNETRNYVYSVSANAQRMGNVRSVIDSQEFKNLDGQQQAQIASRTVQIQDQVDSAYRVNIQQRITDDAARAQSGLNIESPVTEAEFIRSIPSSATPGERAQFYQQWNRYKDTLALQPVNNFVMQNSAADGLAAVQALKPADNAADLQFKAQQYAQAQQNYQRIISARESDPGKWLSQYSDVVKSAWDQYLQDPARGADYAHSVIAEKQRLGIKSKDILPDAAAFAMLQQIDNNKESSVADIQAVGKQFGQYSPIVMAQVQKKSSPVLQVVMATENPRAANALWQNRDAKTDDLRRSFDKPKADSADSSWNDQAKDFAGTMIVQPGGTAVWNNFNEQGKRLTYINMQRGMPPSDASKQAYQDILGSQYQTNGTWRLAVTAGQDIRDVNDGANEFLKSLKPEQIMPLIGDPRLPEKVNREQSISRIRDNAQWVTNGDETGLTLMMNGLLVNGANGNPITVSFGDLAKLGAGNRSTWNDITKFAQTPVTYTPGQSKNYSVESQRENILNVLQNGQQAGR
ncbi:transglycosylase SLT domain-containing protein [Klebsiella michiganensis]